MKNSALTCDSFPTLTDDQQRQLAREKDKRDEWVGKKMKQDDEFFRKDRGSQARSSKGLLQILVPAVEWWLENHYEASTKNGRRVNQALAEYTRIKRYMSPLMMAHISTTVVLDNIGTGTRFKSRINSIQKLIGEYIDDQAMLEYYNEQDPYYFAKLQKKYLHDPVRRYDKKVYAVKHLMEANDKVDNYQRMTEEQHGALGALMLRAVMSIPANHDTKEGFFEKRVERESKTKTIGYLALSKTGMMYRHQLQEAANRLEFKPLPMICEPIPWSINERGGYLMPPPGTYSRLIHSHNPTVPSPSALDALNRLQRVPYRINTFILDVQKHLLQSTNHIGCFKSYEKDSWIQEFLPKFDSNQLATMDKQDPEYRRIMRTLTKAYQQQKLDEKEGINPIRVTLQAEELRDEVFYTPWFFDSRLRLYPVCELGVTKGDFVKALLVNANPLPITKDTERELLIAIATSGDFDKISKGTYEERLEWAKKFVKSGNFEMCVLYPESSGYWRDADEPFQFLSYCEEYYALFVAKTRDTTRVFVGRDMSCSGIQFLSSLIGDEKAMAFTNVIPSDTLQDAYGEVARIARELLTDKAWLRKQLDKREAKRLLHNKRHPDKEKKQRMTVQIDVNAIDRSVVKTQVMVTGYGGTYLSKREYIVENLKELVEKKGKKIHKDDFNIVVNACIEGMAIAFPKYTELNDWFKTVAKAALEAENEHIKWITPNGSYIAQDYRLPAFSQIDTYAANGGHYMLLMTNDSGQTYVQKGWRDEIQKSKHGSAIAANFTHSLDACVIQNGLLNVDESIPVTTVHDCTYSVPGYMDQVVPHFRQAFYGVCTSPVLENLLDENNIADSVEMIPKEEFDLSVCKNSPYMFS